VGAPARHGTGGGCASRRCDHAVCMRWSEPEDSACTHMGLDVYLDKHDDGVRPSSSTSEARKVHHELLHDRGSPCIARIHQTGLESLSLGPPHPFDLRLGLHRHVLSSLFSVILIAALSANIWKTSVCIDTCRLDRLNITFDDEANFDTSKLVQFINRSSSLAPDEACL
jgi:hypothetical protein